jgi:hypothetical protein
MLTRAGLGFECDAKEPLSHLVTLTEASCIVKFSDPDQGAKFGALLRIIKQNSLILSDERHKQVAKGKYFAEERCWKFDRQGFFAVNALVSALAETSSLLVPAPFRSDAFGLPLRVYSDSVFICELCQGRHLWHSCIFSVFTFAPPPADLESGDMFRLEAAHRARITFESQATLKVLLKEMVPTWGFNLADFHQHVAATASGQPYRAFRRRTKRQR